MDKRKYSTLLIWSAALISVVRYMGAFLASDVGSINGTISNVLSFLMGVTGVGMGILDSIGTAFLFNGWRLAMPRTGDHWKPRFKILTFFVFGLFLTGLFILIPFTVSRVSHLSMWEVLGEKGTWAWSLFVNIAPVLIIGGVMSGNANMVTDNENEQRNGSYVRKTSFANDNVRTRVRSSSTNVREDVLNYLERTWNEQERIAGPAEIVATGITRSRGFASDITKQWKNNKGIN